MKHLFYYVNRTNLCNYADDTIPHTSGYKLNEILIDLEHDSNLILEWFRDNYMTLKESKCHLLVYGNKHECVFCRYWNQKVIGRAYIKIARCAYR